MSAKPNPPAVGQSDPQWCPKCNTPSKRNLVVCIDGTSNQFSIRNTNVVELYSRLIKDENQRTFYNSGIGTYAKPHGLTLRQWIANKRDLAFAWQFDKVLLSAYRWLSENYEPGDRIFLFGFSRGAYQVRALSAMIRDVGLIHKGNQDQIPFAYQLYADPNSRVVSSKPLSTYESVKSYLYHKAGKKYTPKTGSTFDALKTDSMKVDEEPINLADRFKTTFCRKDVKVHFVGVWDTVSSVGLVYGKTLPGTTDGMEHTCFFRHALAIHERRVKFLPEFADTSNKTDVGSNAANTTEGDRGAGAQHNPERDGLQGNEAPRVPAGPSVSNNVRSETPPVQSTDDLPGDDTLRTPKKDINLDAQEQHIKEVWFAGSHSDIGGGNVPNARLDRFGPSLRWMSFESMLAGLKLGDDPRKWEDGPKKFEPYESLTWLWWILEIFPVKQLSFLDPSKRDATIRWPHLGQWRRAFDGQKIHETALEIIGRKRLCAKALEHLEKREKDAEADSATAPIEQDIASTPVEQDSASTPSAPVQRDAHAPPPHLDRAYGPDLKLLKWPDLDIESDPYHDALSFLQLLKARGLTRESDVGRLDKLLSNEAGRNSIRDAVQKLIDEDVQSTYPNYERRGGRDFDDETRLKVEKSSGKVLSEWGSRLLSLLRSAAAADPEPAACARTLSALFRLFDCLKARISFSQVRELRRLAKPFAKPESRDSEDLRKLVNSVIPAALDFPLRDDHSMAVFHPDGKRVILSSMYADESFVLDYSSSPLSPPLPVANGCSVFKLAVSGDGAFIGVALALPRETVLTIWDATSPGDEPIHTVENAPDQIWCLAFNHDGTRLVAGCRGGAIIVWTRADGPVWSPLASFPADTIWSISWSRDNYVAVGSLYGFLSVWDMGTASAPIELLPRTKVGPCVDCLAFAPITTPESSPIRIVTGGRKIGEPSAHWQLGAVEDGAYRLIGRLMGDGDEWPGCVSFSPDGKLIAAAMYQGKVCLWDADSCKPVCDDFSIPGDPNVLALSFETDDTAVKVVCDDGLVRLLCWK